MNEMFDYFFSVLYLLLFCQRFVCDKFIDDMSKFYQILSTVLFFKQQS